MGSPSKGVQSPEGDETGAGAGGGGAGGSGGGGVGVLASPPQRLFDINWWVEGIACASYVRGSAEQNPVGPWYTIAQQLASSKHRA
mmetsp:Transcript_54323/g.151256  ORF Transcript_54323/g.151256 Transcript_54323/m.151256 type:complete len:86 (-) Transcript_54323:589-846(-)